MPRNERAPISKKDLPAEIAALSDEQKDRLASVVSQMKDEAAAAEPMDSADLVTAFEALNEEGQRRVAQVLNRQTERTERQSPQ